MPKLDGTHLPQRIANRLADLKAGEEVAAKDIKALLSDEQFAAMNAAWAVQQELRKQKRPRTKAEEKELGWKSKREVHIEAYEAALREAEDGLLGSLQKRQAEKDTRAAGIYLDSFFAAQDEGKDRYQAHLAANNDLKRAHLAEVENERISARDKDVRATEDALRAQIRKNMTAEELEQQELIEEHEAAVADGRKKTGKRAGKP